MPFDGEITSEGNTFFNIRTFSRDVFIYTLGQGLLLILGFIQFFIIPKYLSIEDYGYWKLFLLFTTYVGVLHFGFNDGILVCWAGKKIDDIGSEIKTAFKFLIFEQLILISLLALIFYFILNEKNLLWIALSILLYAFIINLTSFFIFTVQAIKRFRLLTIINATSGISFLLFVILFFILQQTQFYYVILSNLLSLFITLFIIILFFRRYLFLKKNSSIQSQWKFGKQNISIGIFILFGNLVGTFFLTFDRLIVSSLFSIQQFAIYAFALTGASILYTFIGAISQVLFPYLSGSELQIKIRIYHTTKSAIILSWAAFLIMYFPLTKIIQYYLPQYKTSLILIQIMLCTVGFVSLIEILHINYFKAYRKQRQYFLFGIIALFFAILLNLLVFRILGTLESIAFATLIGLGGWYIINELILKSILEQNNKKIARSLTIISSYIGVFFLSSFLSDQFIFQMFIYLGFFLLITYIAFRLEIRELIHIVKKLRKGREN